MHFLYPCNLTSTTCILFLMEAQKCKQCRFTCTAFFAYVYQGGQIVLTTTKMVASIITILIQK